MLNRSKKVLSVILFQAALFVAPNSALAQGPLETSGPIVPEKLQGEGVTSIISIIRAVIQFILVIAFVIAFIMLLIGGIRWILAGGDEKAVAGARSTITAALIGLVIVLVAFALIRLVETFFGVSILSGGVTIPTVQNTQ